MERGAFTTSTVPFSSYKELAGGRPQVPSLARRARRVSRQVLPIVGRRLTPARLRPRGGNAPTHSGSMRPTRGFKLEGENEAAVVGEAVPAGQVSAAAAEAANQPILGHVRGANNRWIPEQPHGSNQLGKEGTPRSRCDSLASWARRCVTRDAEGRLVIGCGGVTLPAMVTRTLALAPTLSLSLSLRLTLRLTPSPTRSLTLA